MHPDELAAALQMLFDQSGSELGRVLARTALAEAVAFMALCHGGQAAAAMLRSDADTVSSFAIAYPEYRPTDAVAH